MDNQDLAKELLRIAASMGDEEFQKRLKEQSDMLAGLKERTKNQEVPLLAGDKTDWKPGDKVLIDWDAASASPPLPDFLKGAEGEVIKLHSTEEAIVKITKSSMKYPVGREYYVQFEYLHSLK